jgi:hypothetical protein
MTPFAGPGTESPCLTQPAYRNDRGNGGHIASHHNNSGWRQPMTDPAADAARYAAAILAPDLDPNLPAEVEAALAARDTRQLPPRHTDPVSLANLIVSIATLAWTTYRDRRNSTLDPPPDSIARQVRITLREQDTPLPLGIERITEIVAAEITRQTNTVSGRNWYGPVLQDRDFTNLTLDAVSDPSTTLKGRASVSLRSESVWCFASPRPRRGPRGDPGRRRSGDASAGLAGPCRATAGGGSSVTAAGLGGLAVRTGVPRRAGRSGARRRAGAAPLPPRWGGGGAARRR